MIIGCPSEIKAQEGRVGITPANTDALVRAGHKVILQAGAGLQSGFSDEEYVEYGAQIAPDAESVYAAAEMIIKVKEPLESEYPMFREGQILFTYLHLAPDPHLTKALMDRKVIAIGYETVQLPSGALPLLSPMSVIAGPMSIQIAAHLLESTSGGRGILLYGVPGVHKGNIVIIGGGSVGASAAKVAVGMGANVTVLDVSAQRLAYLDDIFGSRIQTLISNSYNIARAVKEADAVIGCVLIPGGRTPILVTEEMVKTMKPGSVLIDVAIDQGGSIETMTKVTTHENPTFVSHGVLHYSVANMPGAVPHTSTVALTNSTLPYALKIANLGAEAACKADSALMSGLNLYRGKVTCRNVAEAQDLEYTDPTKLF